MEKPIVTFTTDLGKEEDYVSRLYETTKSGLYQKGDFLPLPYLARGIFYSVHIPGDINTREIDKHEKYRDEIVRNWKENERGFFEMCGGLLGFEKELKNNLTIEILLTEFGTPGSFMVKKSRKHIFVTNRIDFGLDNLQRTVILALYRFRARKRQEIGELGWHKRMAAVDMLFPKFKKKRPTENMRQDSEVFLESLGYPCNQTLDKKIKNVEKTFTSTERLVYRFLAEKNGEIVGFDDLAEAIWEDEYLDKFSLFALSKIIERIRRKIRAQGIYKEVIRTCRGRGYCLNY